MRPENEEENGACEEAGFEVEALLEVLVRRIELEPRIKWHEQVHHDGSNQQVGAGRQKQLQILLVRPGWDTHVADGAQVGGNERYRDGQRAHPSSSQKIFRGGSTPPVEEAADGAHGHDIAAYDQ